MMEILFYHLERSPLEAVLPGLLERTLQRGERAMVKAGGEERLKALDDLLWTFRDDSFLPHGRADEPHAADQPILLTLEDARINGAGFIFAVGGAALPLPDQAGEPPPQRLILIFDGNDNNDLDAARSQWKALRGSGHALTYWQQGESGRWEKKG
jgi:DNA polymerase III subunit chi